MRQTLGALALLLLGCTANITGGDGKNAIGPGVTGLGSGGGVNDPSGPGSSGTGGSGLGSSGAGTTTLDCPTTATAK
ncbi:MAG TPA: hypothetical protein VNG33_12910, partial [Polyangiaceae bacterium]|nr:hypothetical protein [Polyangiaceae bacterium]